MSAIRTVRWDPPAQAAARALPEPLRGEVRALLAELATGPLPPPGGVADPDAPGIYHLVTPRTSVTAGVYEDEVRVWIVRVDT